MHEPIVINEVGLRDGLQNLAAIIPLEGKLRLLTALVNAGVRHLEVTSFASSQAVPQLADADALVARLPKAENVHYSVLVPNQKGYDRAKLSGARSIAVVIAATETLNRKNINMSLAQAVDVSKQVISRAKTDGGFARAYIAAAFACPYEGKTPLRKVVGLASELLAAGADEIAVADTIGAGNPAQVREMFGELIHAYGRERIAAHFHDTRAMALALTWAALEAGVRKFDSSIGGLGGCPFAPGASGNLATEDLVFLLQDCGFATGIRLPALMEAVAVAAELVGKEIGGRILPWYRTRNGQTAPSPGASNKFDLVEGEL